MIGGVCLQAKSHKAKRIRDNLFIRVLRKGELPLKERANCLLKRGRIAIRPYFIGVGAITLHQGVVLHDKRNCIGLFPFYIVAVHQVIA